MASTDTAKSTAPKKGSGRWAVIVKTTGEVSDIKQMRGGAEPEIRPEHDDRYDVQEVGPEVAIGMVRSGSGFVWPQGHEKEGQSVGVTRLSDATAADDSDRHENPTPQPEEMKPVPAPAAKDGKAPAKAKAKA